MGTAGDHRRSRRRRAAVRVLLVGAVAAEQAAFSIARRRVPVDAPPLHRGRVDVVAAATAGALPPPVGVAAEPVADANPGVLVADAGAALGIDLAGGLEVEAGSAITAHADVVAGAIAIADAAAFATLARAVAAAIVAPAGPVKVDAAGGREWQCSRPGQAEPADAAGVSDYRSEAGPTDRTARLPGRLLRAL